MVDGTKQPAKITFLLNIADDQMIAGHRLSEWTSKAPTLEEDLALPNMALDLLGQASALYSYVGECEGLGRSEDDLAFLRNEREYSNLLMLELHNRNFARTMLRHLYFSLFMMHYWDRLQQSSDFQLAAIAGKAIKECRYHVRHCAEWVIRLGDGTEKSAQILQEADAVLTPYLGEMFHDAPVFDGLDADFAPRPSSIADAWLQDITPIYAQAFLEVPELHLRQRGGREGIHTEDLGYLLAEMQSVHRSHPNVQW